MSPHRERRGHPRASARRWLLAGLVVAAILGGTGRAGAEVDPGLDQTIAADEPIAAGPAAITRGHVDIGPRYVEGAWTLLVHDDSVVPAVWRSLDEVVLRVDDSAAATVPDDPTYAFLGVEAGTPVHVVPQTQDPDVVWVGWNTQDPEVMATVDRGATLTLLGVQGPGTMTMFLQSGTLGAPEVLWSSQRPEAQPLWVDVNTHTHANWVFTRPGVYLVHVDISAVLIDGETVRDRRTLRFAVGDGTTTEEALAASYDGPVAAGPADDAVAPADAAAGDEGGTRPALLAGLAAVAAVGLVGGAVVVRRGQRARQQAEHERQARHGKVTPS